ncbi:MAG: MBL fold metallo-hydrolase [Spirochaetaceae bacterium]|jgi:phosphoribosyl 1,2-cyclic phosphodiesterase|nr:MBL fold metallo-hydrolase [Spirochaetaceae bacterium]
MFYVRFWGVRGSIACPGSSTLKFGGNTTCLEIRADDRLIIIDMGTGIAALGNYLLSRDSGSAPVNSDIFFSHTHHDHLAGFPMFGPLFLDSTKLRIYGPRMPGNKSIEDVLSTHMSYMYWPVRLNELSASLQFIDLGVTRLDLGGGLTVSTTLLNHPVICLGYRFEYKGKSIVTSFDTEIYWNIFEEGPVDDFFIEDALRAGAETTPIENQRLLDFYEKADILIYDTQYTDEEYTSNRHHWGHSTYKHAIAIAEKVNVKKLVLFHHDPARNDESLTELEKTCETASKSSKGVEIIISKEGMVVET